MKVAMLGATGFVGSALLKEALDRGHAVTAIVRHPEKLENREGFTAKAGDVYDTDMEGAKEVQQAFFPPQSFSIPCLSCETFYQPARTLRRQMLLANCGGWKDWSDCCGLAGGWRQMKSSSASWPKCPSSQMASHSAMM